MTNEPPPPQSEIILYQTENGGTRIQCRFENETLWLTQAFIAELFQKNVRTINEHLVNIFEEGESSREATIRNFRIVRQEGNRQVARDIEYAKYRAFLDTQPRAIAAAFEQKATELKKLPHPKRPNPSYP